VEETQRPLLSKLQDLDSIWNPLDAAASEATFRALLNDARPLANGNQTHVIELLSLIGRAEAVQGKFAEAVTTLKEAERILEGETL
jgi:hypothetical protein